MILPLSELISRAVERALEERIAIAFSGGLDSTVLATIAKKHSQVELFCAGTEGSEDLSYADKVASQLGLPLEVIPIEEKTAMAAYGKCHSFLPMDFLKLEIMVPVYLTAEAAAKRGHKVMLFGSAAEELFVGYEKYYIAKEEGKDVESMLKDEFRTLPQRDMAWIRRVCRCFGIEARFPFHDKDIGGLMFSVPLEERMDDREMKKGILREAAKVLGVPELALKRKKKAMQYGSGVHKMLFKKIDEINRDFPGPQL
ncbi:MAG: asparagine synthase C-terminal domain-containing protein [Candidatus Micrarchaeota archaeon]